MFGAWVVRMNVGCGHTGQGGDSRHVAVIPTLDPGAARRVKKTVEQLNRAGHEVIVMANSRDVFHSLREAALESVEVRTADTNLGFGGSINVALHGSFETALILNDDVDLDDDAIRQIVTLSRNMMAEPMTGAVSLVPRVDRHVTLWPSPFGVLLRVAGLWRLGKSYGAVLGRQQYEFFCVVVNGACWSDVGGFDAVRYPLYFEDADFVRRGAALGYEFKTVASSVRHHGSATSRRHLETIGLQTRGAASYLVSHEGWSSRAASGALRICNAVGAALDTVFRRRREARCRWEIARNPLSELRAELPPYDSAG